MNYHIFQNVIVDCVESLVKIRPEDKNAVLFNFRLKTYYSVDDDFRPIQPVTRFQVVVTINSNYKKVFYRVFGYDGITDWIFTADHDSCWKWDGFSFMFKHWLEHRDALLSQVKFKHKANDAVNFDTCSFYPFFQFVNVEWKNENDGTLTYGKRLTKIIE